MGRLPKAIRGLVVVPLVLAAAGALAAGIEVRRTGDRVSVRANAAPLSEVLERLSQETGMKVVWERNLGRPNVTAALESCTPAEAVLALMQGTGFNYALRMDPSGTRVEMLMIVGVPGPGPQPGVVRPRQVEDLPQEDSASDPEKPDAGEPQTSPLDKPAAPVATSGKGALKRHQKP